MFCDKLHIKTLLCYSNHTPSKTISHCGKPNTEPYNWVCVIIGDGSVLGVPHYQLPEGTNLEVFQFSFPDQFRKEVASGRRVLDLNR